MNKKSTSIIEKKNTTNKYLSKLMRISIDSVNKGRKEKALSSLGAFCSIQYSINQVYTDKQTEDLISEISKKLVTIPDEYNPDQKTVLFYDGFGLDLRGWAASYIKALISANYHVIYVAPIHRKELVPHICDELNRGNGRAVWIDMKKSYVNWVIELKNIFLKFQPGTAFFYTIPYDVAGAVVFNSFAKKVNRILIDLTDHAFWIGKNAFDYIIECRMPGLSNLVHYRGVSADKILYTDCCLYINRQIDPEPLPFDIEREQYVFSGGALYKTLGDNNLYFYKIVDHILSKHSHIKFLYAGVGDDTQLKILIKKYPERVFHINERSDFIRLFENCIFFLNTFPMFGGLMMRYSALVNKIPLTLKHGSDHEGILIDQDKRQIEFDTFEELIHEADRLIEDNSYRESKEKLLDGSVLTEQEFEDLMIKIIENKTTGKQIESIEKIDTTEFRAEYLERLDVDEMLIRTIPTRINKSLIPYYPLLFLKKYISLGAKK